MNELLTMKNRTAHRESLPTATFSITNHTWTGLR